MEEEIKLDTYLTPELKEEGIVREFTRLVQDLRKRANLKPKDKIALSIDLAGPSLVALNKHVKHFSKEVGASSVEFKHADKFDAEFSGRVESSPVWIGIRKI
ncbi:MAG: hypothetical protein HYT09_02955 [Candidatus Levybacteria bacterium]|nr:hypothetical protein [Candidatus Levybacteria bacterium]